MKDEDAVAAAALDYFESWYAADPERMAGVLHPELVKRSVGQVTGAAPGATTRDRMVELTGAGEGSADRTDDPIEVTVADVHHDIASAVVRSAQYREYLHLVRTPEGWQIASTLWQLTEPSS